MNVAAPVVLLLASGAMPAEGVTRALTEEIARAFTPPPTVRIAAWQPAQSGAAPAAAAHTQTLVLDCPDAGCTRATLQAVTSSAPSAPHTLSFAATDGLAQRGRAIGLVAVVLLSPELDAAPTPEVAPPPPPPPESKSAVWAGAGSAAVSMAPTGPMLLALAAGIQRSLPGRCSLRAALRVEYQDMDDMPASSEALGGAIGLGWTGGGFGRQNRLRWGGRLEALVMRRHAQMGEDAAASDPAYWAAGGQGLATLGYAASADTEVRLGAGIQEMLGAPAHEPERRMIPPLQSVVGLEIQSSF